jgi:hypothetical protein
VKICLDKGPGEIIVNGNERVPQFLSALIPLTCALLSGEPQAVISHGGHPAAAAKAGSR